MRFILILSAVICLCNKVKPAINRLLINLKSSYKRHWHPRFHRWWGICEATANPGSLWRNLRLFARRMRKSRLPESVVIRRAAAELENTSIRAAFECSFPTPLETETHMAYELQHTVLVSSLVRRWLTGLAVTVSSFGWEVNIKETRHNTRKYELKATRNAVKPPGLFRSKCVRDFSRHGRGIYRADTPQ